MAVVDHRSQEPFELADGLTVAFVAARRVVRRRGNHHLVLRQLPFELVDDALQLGVASRQGQRQAIFDERFVQVAAHFVDFGDAFEGREVLGRPAKNGRQLDQRRVEIAGLEQRATERGASGKIFGMEDEAGLTDLDGFGRLAVAPQFFCEGREGERRRILLDPATQFLNAGAVRHGDSLDHHGATTSVCVELADDPLLSVTVSFTV